MATIASTIASSRRVSLLAPRSSLAGLPALAQSYSRAAALRRTRRARASCRRSRSGCRRSRSVVDLAARAAASASLAATSSPSSPAGAGHPLHLGQRLHAARRLHRKARAQARHPGEASRTRTTGSSPSRCAPAIAGPTAQPFTAEDFRYYWEDVAQQPGAVAGRPARVHDGGRQAAQLRDPRRAHGPLHLGQAQPALPAAARRAASTRSSTGRPTTSSSSTRKYADKAKLEEAAKQQKLKSWAALHNRMDDMYENTNPDLPTLQAWRVMNAAPGQPLRLRAQSLLPPRRHDGAAAALCRPRSSWTSSASGLFAAKANAGEVDLLFRGLSMSDIPILKEGEKAQGLQDPALALRARHRARALSQPQHASTRCGGTLNRDVRFRRALSLGIDRKTLNNALLFGLGIEGNNTIMAESPLFSTGAAHADTRIRPGGGLAPARRDRADEAQRRRHPPAARTGANSRSSSRPTARAASSSTA